LTAKLQPVKVIAGEARRHFEIFRAAPVLRIQLKDVRIDSFHTSIKSWISFFKCRMNKRYKFFALDLRFALDGTQGVIINYDDRERRLLQSSICTLGRQINLMRQIPS